MEVPITIPFVVVSMLLCLFVRVSEIVRKNDASTRTTTHSESSCETEQILLVDFARSALKCETLLHRFSEGEAIILH